MNGLDLETLSRTLRTIECIALIPVVSSTNALARRIAAECYENELPLPSAILIAGEQLSGRGREARRWHSPAGKGIYATIMHTRPVGELSLMPLAVGAFIAEFLIETYGLDARLKWPNDVLVGGRKIAGTLIEARSRDGEADLMIGIGINVEPSEDAVANSTSIAADAGPRARPIDVGSATEAFVEYLDRRLAEPLEHAKVTDAWARLSAHKPGDRISCTLPDRTVEGVWEGIDATGRAMIRSGSELMHVSAGEIIAEPK